MALTKRYRLRQTTLQSISRDCLDARLSRALDDEGMLDELVSQPHPGVVEFPLFTETYVETLLRELHLFEHWCEHYKESPTRPNSMNQHGVVLSELGLDEAMDDLVAVLLPLTRRYFGEHAGSDLDHQHAFAVDYSGAGDTSLGFHVDDSEVTLNACLGLSFEGADVYFRGERCATHRESPANDNEAWQWSPTPGRAILHAGAHRHGVHPLISGRRINLIVWAKSSRYRRVHLLPHAAPKRWCRDCA